jgi:hypothetical protein
MDFFQKLRKAKCSLRQGSSGGKGAGGPNNKSKKVIAKKVKKACRTRWLSTDLEIRGVFEDFVPLT